MTDEREDKLRDKLMDALERERTLRQAVEWYADPKNWGRGPIRGTLATVDRGNRARAALKNA
jgi:hypothetical protein